MRDLLPYLASVTKNEGTRALGRVCGGIREPVLQKGVQLLCEEVASDTIAEQLEELAQSQLKRDEKKYRMAIDGIVAMSKGKSPREVAEVLAAI